MLIWPPGKTRTFPPGEYEIAKFVFDVSPTCPSGFMELHISNVGIYGNNKLLGNRGMSGALFIED